MYDTRYTDTALKQLAKLPRNWRERIVAKVRAVAIDPHASMPNARALKGSPFCRLRVGHWWVIYDIDDGVRVITIIKVGPRGSVYDD